MGLDTLVSGNYIALQPGDGEPTTKFTALESQPSDTPVADGLKVQLCSLHWDRSVLAPSFL